MKVAHWLLAVAVAWWLRQGSAAAELGDCQYPCGDVLVPYPFGLDLDCARSSDFVLTCTNTEARGIQLLLGSLRIRQISVGDSTMVVSLPEAYECYDQNGNLANNSVSVDVAPSPRYSLSDAQNNLTVLGCGVLATVADNQGTFGSGCVSYCGDNTSLANETTCSGHGCCQASIPRGIKTLRINVSLVNTDVSALPRNPCGVAFVADKRTFNSSNWTLPSFDDVGKGADLRLDWTVESDVACAGASGNKSSYACVGANTECRNVSMSGPGYQCVCKEGYEGNPYNLKQGCTDINECLDPKRYPCRGKCRNFPGNYSCDCPFGKTGDGKVGCKSRVIVVATIAGAIVLPIFGGTFGFLLHDTWRRRRRRRSKQKNFRRNGGELLKRQRVKIFTEAELEKATNNYDDSNKLGEGGFGSVYRGRVAGDTEVAVKKPKDVRKSLVKGDFHQELETVIQMNHKNVVKLHGICLETRIPLLVYEYISNGNLFQHIHQNASTFLRSWNNRLRIAAEAALALEYMHSCAEPPIIHGDFKSANILLDRNYSVKVSDFGTSVLISPEHNCIGPTEVQGTLGYIDPEYLTTGMLTIKSDVYSFGAVLVELLTVKKPTSFVPISGESINIIHYFISPGTDKRLSDVMNFEAASKDEMEKVGMVAEIAMKCLDQSSVKRPAMREVAEQLVRINHELDNSTVEENNEETECKVDEENLYSHATSIACETGQHGTSRFLF